MCFFNSDLELPMVQCVGASRLALIWNIYPIMYRNGEATDGRL